MIYPDLPSSLIVGKLHGRVIRINARMQLGKGHIGNSVVIQGVSKRHPEPSSPSPLEFPQTVLKQPDPLKQKNCKTTPTPQEQFLIRCIPKVLVQGDSGRRDFVGFPELLGTPWTFSEFARTCPSDFPGTSLTVDFKSNPEFPGSFPDFSGTLPDFSGSSPDLPTGQPLSVGSLRPCDDSKKLPLILEDQQ